MARSNAAYWLRASGEGGVDVLGGMGTGSEGIDRSPRPLPVDPVLSGAFLSGAFLAPFREGGAAAFDLAAGLATGLAAFVLFFTAIVNPNCGNGDALYQKRLA